MTDPQRLRELPGDRFGALVAEVLDEAWTDWEVEVAPASPEGGVEAVASRDGRRRIIRVQQAPAGSAVTDGAIRDLAALTEDGDGGVEAATFVTTDEFSAAAREAATECGVELIDGDGFAEMVRRADATVERDDTPSVATLVDAVGGDWPESLRERAAELAAFVEASGPLERTVTRGDDLVDVEFAPAGGGTTAVKLRFLEDGLLAYVRRDGTFDSVVRLTAHRDSQPSMSELREDLGPAISEALEEE